MLSSKTSQVVVFIFLLCAITALYGYFFSNAASSLGIDRLTRVYKVVDDGQQRAFDPHIGPTSAIVTISDGQQVKGKSGPVGATNNGGKIASDGSKNVKTVDTRGSKEGMEKRGELPGFRPFVMEPQKPLVLRKGDAALVSGRRDGSPIVVPELKLIFFSMPKNGGTVFKKLFRRVSGQIDWLNASSDSSHDPKQNGLTYLSSYSAAEATKLVNDKDWTVAAFFRDPFSRFLSVYLDSFSRESRANLSFAQFVAVVEKGETNLKTTLARLKLETGTGVDKFALEKMKLSLTSQCALIDCDKWYPYLAYIGSFENLYEDTRTLLEHLGGWEKYGSNGWGGASGELFKSTIDGELVTNATHRMHEYYTPELRQRVAALLQKDVQFLAKMKLERLPDADTGSSTVTTPSAIKQLDMTRLNGMQPIVLKKGDPELHRHAWEGSPIVVEKFKLLFFSIPKNSCTIFKKLFRRIEGKTNWNSFTRSVPHDPRKNGLRYLYKYSPEEANRMVNDPEWTVAIFIRDPFARFLSAYLDKGRKRVSPFSAFITRVERGLKNVHWNPQCHLVDCPKWLPRLDFIGSVENIFEDTKELLQRLGAWEEYGKTGWGGTGEIFKGSVHKSHVTNADDKMNQYYTPQLKERVRKILHKDFEFIETVQRLKSGNRTNLKN